MLFRSTLENKPAGSIDVADNVFGAPSRPDILARVVDWQLAKRRAGTHKAKGISDVQGTTKKPYAQKGTGRARQGSTRAPQFAGGGVVHGPTPRNYEQRTPKKMKAAALRGALSDRARDGRIHVITEFVAGETPSTKAAVQAIEALGLAGNILIAIDRDDDVSALSLRNVTTVHVLYVDQLNTYDVLCSDQVVFTSAALDAFLAGPASGKSVKAVATESEAAE